MGKRRKRRKPGKPGNSDRRTHEGMKFGLFSLRNLMIVWQQEFGAMVNVDLWISFRLEFVPRKSIWLFISLLEILPRFLSLCCLLFDSLVLFPLLSYGDSNFGNFFLLQFTQLLGIGLISKVWVIRAKELSAFHMIAFKKSLISSISNSLHMGFSSGYNPAGSLFANDVGVPFKAPITCFSRDWYVSYLFFGNQKEIISIWKNAYGGHSRGGPVQFNSREVVGYGEYGSLAASWANSVGNESTQWSKLNHDEFNRVREAVVGEIIEKLRGLVLGHSPKGDRKEVITDAKHDISKVDFYAFEGLVLNSQDSY